MTSVTTVICVEKSNSGHLILIERIKGKPFSFLLSSYIFQKKEKQHNAIACVGIRMFIEHNW